MPDLSNFYVVNYGSKYGDDPDAEVNDFFKRFEAKYGKKADVSYGLRGYSAVQAWATAANKAGSLDGDKVAAVLDTFDKEPLVIGPTTYTPDLHIQTTRPMSIIGVTRRQVRRGRPLHRGEVPAAAVSAHATARFRHAAYGDARDASASAASSPSIRSTLTLCNAARCSA